MSFADDKTDGQSDESTLAKSCKEILTLQSLINNATRELQKAIEARGDKKPDAVAKLAARQKEVIRIVDREIERLKKDAAAEAFQSALQGLREDCSNIQGRLEKGDLGKQTQDFQNDLEESLREMIDSLRPRCPGCSEGQGE